MAGTRRWVITRIRWMALPAERGDRSLAARPPGHALISPPPPLHVVLKPRTGCRGPDGPHSSLDRQRGMARRHRRFAPGMIAAWSRSCATRSRLQAAFISRRGRRPWEADEGESPCSRGPPSRLGDAVCSDGAPARQEESDRHRGHGAKATAAVASCSPATLAGDVVLLFASLAP